MTTERALLVRLPVDELGLRQLLGDIRSAAARVTTAYPGDRTDVIRYEALSSQLERAAMRQLGEPDVETMPVDLVDRDADSFYDNRNSVQLSIAVARDWISQGDIAVELRLPFIAGAPAALPVVTSIVAGPAKVWRAELSRHGQQLAGSLAVANRFEQQLEAALDGESDAVMRPSGIANRALTDGLRRFAEVGSGRRRDVPVIYKDGSRGPDFPLRCLVLRDEVPIDWPTYSFAMLSIRHTEMDAEVDGAWLRNTDISRPRPAGDTDRLAFDQSQTQLDRLTSSEPALIYLYQTGLDSAVVGIYRAVVEHLLRGHDNLAVVPMYFRRQPTDQPVAPVIAGYRQQATFSMGETWRR